MSKSKKTTARKPRTDHPPLEVGPLNEFVGYRLRRTQLAVYADFMSGQGPSPLTPGLFGVLALIDSNPDITQQRLCESIGVDKSTLVVTLHRLSDRGLIRRVRSTEDRRQNGLRLTAKGQTRYKAMIQHVRAHERRITARLTPKESEQLVQLLAKLG